LVANTIFCRVFFNVFGVVWGSGGEFAIECVKNVTNLIAKGGFDECSLYPNIIYNNNIIVVIQG
jgi:hypothetical protein